MGTNECLYLFRYSNYDLTASAQTLYTECVWGQLQFSAPSATKLKLKPGYNWAKTELNLSKTVLTGLKLG